MAKQKRNSKGPDKRGLQSAALIFCGVLFFITAVFTYVWCHINVRRLNYQIAEELQRQRKLEVEHDKLKIEIATLKSSSNIEKIAREKLGMDYPKKNQVIFIKE